MTAVDTPLPLPSLEMRQLVGPTADEDFDNPSGDLIFPYLAREQYASVFDFGCGCGRIARQLMQQRDRPQRYVGIDLHRGMIEWCKQNLAPRASGFSFAHHDVYNFHFNPNPERPTHLPFPVESGSFSLVNAISVFTHLTEEQTLFYLAEVRRILAPHGLLHSTWFFFDKSSFPMLHPSQNALYVSYVDPSAAVIYARDWVRAVAHEAGLKVVRVTAPQIRGYHWLVMMASIDSDLPEVAYPADEGEVKRAAGPPLPDNSSRIGLART
jgi:SAM-dependent methyltransferase